MDHLVGVGHDCFGANMPDDMSDCRGTVAVWAVGGGVILYLHSYNWL